MLKKSWPALDAERQCGSNTTWYSRSHWRSLDKDHVSSPPYTVTLALWPKPPQSSSRVAMKERWQQTTLWHWECFRTPTLPPAPGRCWQQTQEPPGPSFILIVILSVPFIHSFSTPLHALTPQRTFLSQKKPSVLTHLCNNIIEHLMWARFSEGLKVSSLLQGALYLGGEVDMEPLTKHWLKCNARGLFSIDDSQKGVNSYALEGDEWPGKNKDKEVSEQAVEEDTYILSRLARKHRSLLIK